MEGRGWCSEAICWSCGCKSHHCNSQFGSVVIPDSGWSNLMAESTEVKAFYREASNQKGRSESERNRRRNSQRCSCQVSVSPGRWLLSLLEETERCTQGGFRRTEGGNSGKSSRESSEGLRTSQDDPMNDKDRSYNRRGKWKGGL